MADNERTAELLDRAVAVWRRRKSIALAAFLLPTAATIGLVPSLPSVYKAAAVVLVERQQVPESFVRSTVTGGVEPRLHTISQQILSRARLEDLIERFGLYPELRARLPMEALVERMRKDIRVELRGIETVVRTGSLVAFTVSYLSGDPDRAARVANTLASYYLEENTRVREHQASSTAEFLRHQLLDVKRRLEEQEQRLGAFKARYMGETPQHIQENLMMLERLNTALRLNTERQSRAMERREVMARQLAEAESFATLFAEPGLSASGPVAVDPAAARLAKLRQDLAELRTRFSDKYPDVVRLKAEIAAVEKQVAETAPKADTGTVATTGEPGAPSPYALQLKETAGEVEAELKALRAEEKRLHQDLALYQQRVQNTPRREQQFQILSRDYGTTSDLYRTLLQRYEEAQLAETLEQRQKGEQFRILEAALPPKEPSAPNRLRLVVVGLVMAFGLAIGSVLLAEQLDSSFHTIDDLRAFTQIPVLVGIPRIVSERDSRRRHRWAAATAFLIVLGIGVFGTAAYLVGAGHAPVISPLARAWLLRS